uniref:RRM domain-containing protein n=1 Tax=Eutreptiella gymnastica TaxID=73025 RepID=A0A7S4FHB4_9EUGL
MANSNGHYPSEVPARRGTTTSLSPITPANPNNAPATQPDEVSNEILLRGVVPEIEHSSIRAFAEAFGTVLEVITKPGLQALLRMDSVDSAAKLLDAHPNNTVMISDTQVTLKSVFTQNSLRGPRAGRPRNSLPAGSLTASMHSGHSEPPPGPKVESPAVLLRGVMGITQEDIHLFASKFGAVQDVVLKPGLQALIYMENVDAAGRLLQECGTSAEIKDTPVQLKSVDLEVAGMGRTPTKSAGEQFPASKAPSDAAEPQTCPLPGLELMQKAAEPHELEPLKHYVDQWLAESLPSADKDPQDGTQEQGPRGEADAMVTGAGQPLLNSTQAPLLPVQPASHAMTTAPSFPPQPSQPVSDAQTVREAASTAASPALDPLAAANAVETKGAPLRQDAEPGSTTITAADVESTPAELGRAQDAARSSTTGVQHAPQPEQTVNRGDSWWGRFTRRLVGSSPTVQAVESASLKVAPPASPPEPQNPSSPSESPQATRVQDATEVPQGQRAGDAMPMQPTGPAEDAGPVESTEHKAVEGGTEPVAADCDDAELEGEGDDTGEHFVFSGLGGDWQ